MNQADPNASISGFFAGRSILITGASGYMGVVLVEKLLRSCSDIREIFILLRPKRGVSIEDRIQKMISEELFLLLKGERPEVFKKLIPVPGDTSIEGLGIPEKERRILIDRVSVIFHVAASVRFDDSLKKSVLTNTRSTRDLCILATQMKSLKVFCYVSTAFCQIEKLVIEERVHPAQADWKKTIQICETVDEQVLNAFTPKYIGGFPNTYTFAKRLGEQVISDFSHLIPTVIFRPSIVLPTCSEPLYGWMNNFNGPIALSIGCGKGVLRVCHADPDLISDHIPVDVAIKTMIIATWKRAIKPITQDPTPHVYNCSSAGVKEISSSTLHRGGLTVLEEVPMEGIVWAPRITYFQNGTAYFYAVLLFHLLPALFIDGMLLATGRKPMLVKKQRKIYIGNKAVGHFLLNTWQFKNDKFHNLAADIPAVDLEKFDFEYAPYDTRDYTRLCILGAKKYLLNEDYENLEPAKRHLRRMKFIDKVVRGMFVLLPFWMIIQYEMVDYVVQKFYDGIEFLLSDI